MSTTAGNIAAATALASHPDTHPEHRYPRKLDADLLFYEQSITQHPSELPQNEGSDAVLSALSESLHSESGRKKRVSWSQERQDLSAGGSSRRHMSPVVPAMLHHKSASTAALLARGRSPRRDEETEDLSGEQVVGTEQRNASRASRRSVGMVLLGVGVLFGIGRYTGGTQPMVGRGLKTGAVLVPTSNPDLSLAIGLPITENPHNHLMDSPPSSVDVELPPLPSEAGFSQQRRPDEDTSYERVVGRIFAWLCTTLYLTSRLPQIWKNVSRVCVATSLAITLTVPLVRQEVG